MPFAIEHIGDRDYVHVTFTGPLTMALAREYLAALLPILEETGCQRLLSDSVNAQIQLSSRDILQFPKMMQASPLTESLKRAVLGSEGTSGYEMFETFSKIQGHDLRIFTDRDDALEWLLSDED